MKILVTGGAGFIGSHVVDAYVAAGHEVITVDNLVTGRPEYLNPEATFIKLDITSPDLADVFTDYKPKIVNHHAAQIDVRQSVTDPQMDARVNIMGSLNLFDRAVRYGVKGIIFASSGGAIYGEQEYFPAGEEHPKRPISPYAISKLAVEYYLHYYRVVHGLRSIILRYANVYGPRQNADGEAGVVALFASKMLRGKTPTIYGDGEQTRDFVFVGDAVRASVLALDLLDRHEGDSALANNQQVFNIGTGKETSVNELTTLLRQETGFLGIVEHAPPKSGEQRRSVLDCAWAKRVLWWEPSVDFRQGIVETVEWFRSRYEMETATLNRELLSHF